MPLTASAFIATSLDGFIARPNGDIDWLDKMNQLVPTGEDAGYGAFIQTVDALVMGRNSFAKVLSFEFWPYQNLPVYVLSTKGVTIPDHLVGQAECCPLSLKELVKTLEDKGHKHVYVDGGMTIQSFIREGYLNEITLTTVPVLLGQGLPLFGTLPQDIPLTLVASKCYDFGFVQSKYRVREG